MAKFLVNLRTLFRAKNKPNKKGGKMKEEPQEVSADEQAIRDAFNAYDTNQDGWIQKEELKNVLTKYLGRAPTEVQLGKIFAKVDLDQNGLIDLKEFKRMMNDRSGKKNEYKEVFKSYDKNGDGLISKEELLEVLNQVEPTQLDEVEEIIAMADQDNDGKINFAEFVDFFV